MKLSVDGREEMLPADWALRVVMHKKGGAADAFVTVERDGETMMLADALALRDLLITNSKPQNRSAVEDRPAHTPRG